MSVRKFARAPFSIPAFRKNAFEVLCRGAQRRLNARRYQQASPLSLVERCEDRLLLTDLSVSVTDDTRAIVTGESITYSVLVTNNGSESVTGAIFDSAISFYGGTFSLSGENLTFPGGGSGTLNVQADGPDIESLSLAAGKSARLTYTLTALTGAGSVVTSSTVTGGSPEDTDLSNNTVITTNAVDARVVDLEVLQSSRAAEIATGESTVYTVVISNRGPHAVSGASFANTLSYAGGSFSVSGESLTFSGSSSATLTVQANGPDLTDLSLASGESATLEFTVTPTTGTGAIISTSTVYGGTAGDSNLSNNTAVGTTTVRAPQSDLSVTQSESRDVIYTGDEVAYTVTVVNNGPQAVTGVSLIDSVTYTGGAFSISSEMLIFSGAGSGTLVVDADGLAITDVSLASGETVTLSFTVTATEGTGIITNTATVTGGTPADFNEANNSASETTAVNAREADLSIEQTGSQSAVHAGDRFSYYVRIRNQGPLAVTGATATGTVDFPTGTFALSTGTLSVANGGGGTVTLNGNSFTISDLSLASSADASLEIIVDLTSGMGTLTSTASVSEGVPADPNPTNNTSVWTKAINAPPAELAVSLSNTGESVVTGNSTTYTAVVTNNGPEAVSDARLDNVIAFSGGTFSVSNEIVEFSGGGSGNLVSTSDGPDLLNLSLDVGETVTVHFTVTPLRGTGLIVGTAAVSNGSPYDDVDSNNLATQTTQVIPTSTILVTTATDENDGTIDSMQGTGTSLREAIIAANLNEDITTITFAPETDGAPFILQLIGRGDNAALTGDLDITEPVIVRGNGRDHTVIDGNGTDRVFDVIGSHAVEFHDLTIRNGNVRNETSANSKGAAINQTGGALTLTGTALQNNLSTRDGAALYFGVGTLEVIESEFTSNESVISNGGAIYVSAGTEGRVVDTRFSENSAQRGAAVYVAGATIEIVSSEFEENDADWDGGAIYGAGAAVVSVEDSSFLKNKADDGGAIYAGGEHFSIRSSSFVENVTLFDGGAVTLDWGATAIIEGSLFVENTAGSNGGAIESRNAELTVLSSTFYANTAGQGGGGLYVYGDLARIVNCTIVGNVASTRYHNNYGGGGIGGNAFSFDYHYLYNSIVAGNFRATSETTLIPDDLGSSSSLFRPESGYNIIGDATMAGGFANGTNGNIVGVNVADILSPELADNGGPTWTFALIGPLAIDMGLNDHAADSEMNPLVVDQRGTGYDRIVNGTVDIGAVEAQAIDLSVTQATNRSTVVSGQSAVYTVEVVNHDRGMIHEVELGNSLSFSGGMYTVSNETLTFTGNGSARLVNGVTGPRLVGLSLAGGEKLTLSFEVNVISGTGSLANTVTLSGGKPIDLNPLNNSASSAISVIPAGTIVVTTANDENNESIDPAFGTGTSLREAIIAANMDPDVNTITFDTSIADRNIIMSMWGRDEDLALFGDFDISTPIVIQGNPEASTVINANEVDRHFDVFAGGDLTLERLVLKGGKVSSGDGGGVRVASGAAATIRESTVAENYAGGSGGAVANAGQLGVVSSTIFANEAVGQGAGLFNTGVVNISNSTISQNGGSNSGGGVANAVGGTVQLFNSTVTGNTSLSGSGVSNSGLASLYNTIVAGNTNGDLSGDFVGMNNLIGDVDVPTGLSGSIIGNARLGQLQDNGGPTVTHALLAGSHAIDAGADDVLSTGPHFSTGDQRGEGYARIHGRAVDIGAYEFLPTAPVLEAQRFTIEEEKLVIGTVLASDQDLPNDMLTFSLTGNGSDASLFSISDSGVLSFLAPPDFEMPRDPESINRYEVEVQVEDQYGETDTATMLVIVSNINESPSVRLQDPIGTLRNDVDTTVRVKIADVVFSDDSLGINVLYLTGADAGLFEIVGSALYLKAGVVLDYETNPVLDVTIEVDDTSLAGAPEASVSWSVAIEDVPEGPVLRPETSIAGFVNGKWWVSRPDANGNYTNQVAASGPASSFQKTLQGDFNGDGLEDLAVWLHNDQWRVGLADGNGKFTFTTWTTWGHPEIKEVHVGDFNNDGKDDIIGLFRNGNRGRWWVGQSDGSRFVNRHWGDYGNYEGIETVLVGNFDGLKGDDLTIVATSGVVWMVKTSNTRFQYLNSHRWSLSNGFEFAQVGDFNGDSRDDVLAVFGTGRDRYVVVAKSIGAAHGFYSGLWSTWTVNDSLTGVVVGDFDGDGRDNVAGLFNGTNVWVGQSTGQRFLMDHWLDWTVSAGRLHEVKVGDSNGDGLRDLFARAADGTWHAAESTGDEFVDRPLSEWYAALDWRYVHLGRFTALPMASSVTPDAIENPSTAPATSLSPSTDLTALARRWGGEAKGASLEEAAEGDEVAVGSLELTSGAGENIPFEEFSEPSLLEHLDSMN